MVTRTLFLPALLQRRVLAHFCLTNQSLSPRLAVIEAPLYLRIKYQPMKGMYSVSLLNTFYFCECVQSFFSGTNSSQFFFSGQGQQTCRLSSRAECKLFLSCIFNPLFIHAVWHKLYKNVRV